jgi:hypothetical protein
VPQLIAERMRDTWRERAPMDLSCGASDPVLVAAGGQIALVAPRCAELAYTLWEADLRLIPTDHGDHVALLAATDDAVEALFHIVQLHGSERLIEAALVEGELQVTSTYVIRELALRPRCMVRVPPAYVTELSAAARAAVESEGDGDAPEDLAVDAEDLLDVTQCEVAGMEARAPRTLVMHLSTQRQLGEALGRALSAQGAEVAVLRRRPQCELEARRTLAHLADLPIALAQLRDTAERFRAEGGVWTIQRSPLLPLRLPLENAREAVGEGLVAALHGSLGRDEDDDDDGLDADDVDVTVERTADGILCRLPFEEGITLLRLLDRLGITYVCDEQLVVGGPVEITLEGAAADAVVEMMCGVDEEAQVLAR